MRCDGYSNFTHRSFVWREDFKAIMEGGGFDVVIGNPPYVRQELFSHLKLYLERRYESYHGVADLFCYFYENGLRLLKQGGHLGYVSSSTFFRTGSGKNLRTHLQANTSLLSVLDFGDLQVFEGVTTYPAILVMTKQPAPADHCFNYMQLTRLPVKIDENTEEKIKDFFTEGAFAIPQSRLNIEGWKFENDALATLRAKIIDGKQTLKQVYGSPLYGIKTGLNKAFVINGATREALIAQDPDCESLIKPFLEGKDLKSWRQEPRDLWLIALTKGFTNSHGNFDTYDEAFAWFSKTYPSLAEWLEPFTEQAKWRTDMGDYWWELRACAYYEEFSKPKIVYAHFQPRPLFSFDTRGSFSNDKSYILPNIGFYELALLNSPVMWFVVKGKSPAVRGKFYELRSQYVDTFPIPSATPAQKQAIAALALKAQTIAESRYCVEQDFIARIRDFGDKKLTERLKNWYEGDFQAFRKDVTGVFKADIPLKERKDWEAFFGEERAKHTALTSTLNVTTKTLNTLVYALFNLTDQDIKLIENNV